MFTNAFLTSFGSLTTQDLLENKSWEVFPLSIVLFYMQFDLDENIEVRDVL